MSRASMLLFVFVAALGITSFVLVVRDWVLGIKLRRQHEERLRR